MDKPSHISNFLQPVNDYIKDIYYTINTPYTGRNNVIIQCEKNNLGFVMLYLYKEQECDLVTVVATDERGETAHFKIRYFFSYPHKDIFFILETDVRDSFPSHSNIIPALSLYEREIKGLFGLHPENHPDPRPLALHPENFPRDIYPLKKDFLWDTKLENKKYGKYKYEIDKGKGFYNIQVNPVEAEGTEPVHCRFAVAGETVLQLETRHFWKHRGIEKLGEGKVPEEVLKYADKIVGDHSFAHTLAYVQTVEKLSETKIPERAKYLRVIFAELERIMCNFNDFALIFHYAGFGSRTQELFLVKEMVMKLNKLLSGSRFNKGVLKIGGVSFSPDDEIISILKIQLDIIKKRYLSFRKDFFRAPSLMDKMKSKGTITRETAKGLSCAGYAARASGLSVDARKTHPYLIYDKLDFKSITLEEGDILSRLQVRLSDLKESFSIIDQCLQYLPGGKVFVDPDPVQPERWTIGYVESQGGTIIHFVMTGEKGEISRWKIKDPSFANWGSLNVAVSGNMATDFPVILESLNVSCAGNDL